MPPQDQEVLLAVRMSSYVAPQMMITRLPRSLVAPRLTQAAQTRGAATMGPRVGMTLGVPSMSSLAQSRWVAVLEPPCSPSDLEVAVGLVVD